MAGAPLATVAIFLVATVALLVPPAAAQSNPLVLIAKDPPGDSGHQGIDIVRVEVVPGIEVLELRLLLQNDPTEVEAALTRTHLVFHHFRVYLELTRDESPSTFVAVLGALHYFGPLVDQSGNPTLAERTWEFDLSIASGKLEEDGQAPTPLQPFSNGIDVDAEVDNRTIIWNVSRAYAFESVGLLSPDEPWTISRAYADAHLWEPVTEGTVDWAADRSAWETLGVDRGPDQEFGGPIPLGMRQSAASFSAPGEDAAPARDEKPDVVLAAPVRFPGEVATHQDAYAAYAFAGGIGVLSLAMLRPRLGYAAFVAFFTRIQRDEALDHPRRSLITEAIRVRPGASFAELRSTLGFGAGLLTHHLAVLERQRIIRTSQERGRKMYFLSAQQARTVSAQPSESKVLASVEAHPGRAAAQVALAAGVSRPSALYHLKRLEAEGAVRSEKTGKIRRFFRAPG